MKNKSCYFKSLFKNISCITNTRRLKQYFAKYCFVRQQAIYLLMNDVKITENLSNSKQYQLTLLVINSESTR